MSTVPGDDALRDAGIVSHDLDEAVNLVDELATGPRHAASPAVPEDYAPGTARPDLSGGADEADVLDQAWAVPADEDHADPA